ncbi:hypothetical protein SAY87_010626 [Trapa incisa]|uniref:BHLH domain-containing protein n=1 Tax=Trapa incisa TaxID=236973 RepID=A0AAN7GUI0_9MYRT|nr:hypothetical protein SAY87_010626 [Trapa incisa]
MVSPDSTGCLYDCVLIDDIPISDGQFQVTRSDFSSPVQAINGFSSFSMDADGSSGDSDGLKGNGSKKRVRSESRGASASKACREKLRRDRLNDKYPLSFLFPDANKKINPLNLLKWSSCRFMELGCMLKPGRLPKTDRAAILIDAVRTVTQLRGETHKLKDANSSLHKKIKDLKVEKNELRDEKQRLKVEKEKLEQQLKTMNMQPSFLHDPPPPAIPACAVIPHGQAPSSRNKLVPVISYPGMAMWQFMPPASMDTSQDNVLHPPVA